MVVVMMGGDRDDGNENDEVKITAIMMVVMVVMRMMVVAGVVVTIVVGMAVVMVMATTFFLAVLSVSFLSTLPLLFHPGSLARGWQVLCLESFLPRGHFILQPGLQEAQFYLTAFKPSPLWWVLAACPWSLSIIASPLFLFHLQ